MSGGSYDYACFTLQNNFIEEFEKYTKGDPLRIAFLAHIKLVFQAMHDIEWVDSGDCSEGDEHEAIKACLAPKGLDETAKNILRALARDINNIVNEDEDPNGK
jgi:hypothetical protein